MSYRSVKALLLGCSGAAALLAATADANAGAFAVREQSAFGQGASFAGVAAGGDLSSMFWNPAAMTQMPGLQSESVLSGILPYTANTPGAGSTLTAIGYGGTDNTSKDALVPAGYYSWQVNPQLWLGLSINAPFGLSLTFPDFWAGRDYAAGGTSLKTYNGTPSIAYRINDMISVGAGVQIQYAKVDLTTGPTPFVNPFGFVPLEVNLSGDGWGYGFTAGITLTPTPTTTIGLGWRSGINQKIDGTLLVAGPFSLPGTTNGSVNTTVDLPDIVSLGVRQGIGPQWTLLGTVEWTNWSRIGTAAISQASGAPATLGGHPVTLPFQYDDGWFFSLGAEYQWSERLAVRGGVAFERSPITDQVRIPLLPDNDRTWLSVGATYKVSNKISFDLAYSHIFVKSTPIAISATSGNPWFDGITYNGDVDSHVDIISAALKFRWDEPPAPPPKSTMYTKAK